jgi:hypothetical protein
MPHTSRQRQQSHYLAQVQDMHRLKAWDLWYNATNGQTDVGRGLQTTADSELAVVLQAPFTEHWHPDPKDATAESRCTVTMDPLPRPMSQQDTGLVLWCIKYGKSLHKDLRKIVLLEGLIFSSIPPATGDCGDIHHVHNKNYHNKNYHNRNHHNFVRKETVYVCRPKFGIMHAY